MTDFAMSPTEYIESRFREYFRDASAINASIDNDCETIDVRIIGPDDGNGPTYLGHYVCEIGSDDDWYMFTDSTMDIITLPLMADALDDDDGDAVGSMMGRNI